MKLTATALALALPGPFSAPVASADDGIEPPYVERVTWVSYDGLSTLRVYPTWAGRDVADDIGKTDAQTDEAWGEVLALAPAADTPGMRSQILCHWHFAEFAQPGKTSWDLEPWRPPVDENTMLLAGCNPGGPEKG